MKKVLLICPPVRNPREVSLIPGGLLSIGGVLRKSTSGGYEIKVYDSCFPNKTSYQEKIEKISKIIKEYVPNFIGLGFPTEAFESAVEIAKQAKGLDKNIVIVVGGIHPTAKPKETMNIPYFDFLVQGEGEITTKELFEAIIQKKDIVDVKGISYKRDGKIIANDSRLEISNLDEIPFDNRDLLIDFAKYSKEALGQIHTSRGCPYNCAYCSSSIIWGKKVRFRSVTNVIKEIDYLYRQYHVKDINFADDNFLLEPE
ncbi:MAG: radical SAM protein, partial [Candidatus Bathyarchaeota archaeon]|nr:radical SAM protein [Candidatus Bathyarchaeota archaeon]